MNPAPPALEISGVRKEYGALRPLRLEQLTVPAGGLVAILGFDAPAAEIFVNLVTGATLPDAGVIAAFGRGTHDIRDGDDWLSALDRFGILSDRAVLLDAFSAAQNLAMTLTLDVDPIPPATRADVDRLAAEVGLSREALDRSVHALTPLERQRVRLGRAIALRPDLLVMEHPSASLPREDVARFAEAVRAVVIGRGIAGVAVTADAAFASAMTREVFTLRPADGVLVREAGAIGALKRLFGGR